MYKKLLLGLFALFVCLGLAQGANAITLSGIPDVSFDEDGSNNSVDLDDYVGDANGTVIFSYTYFDGTENVHVSINANNVVTFTADSDWNGQEKITFNATDDSDSDTHNMWVTVNAVNDAPVLSIPSTLTARADVAYSYQVNATDVDEDGLTFSADAGTWTTFSMNNNGLISFTPTELDIGSQSVAITVSDGTLNDSATVRFWITENCDDGTLEIKDVDIDDITEDDDDTAPGDYLDIELEVKNNLASKEMEDVEVKAWIEDSDGDKVADKVESDNFNIDEKESEDVELTLRIDPDTNDGDYTLVIEAKGEDEDGQTRCNTYIEEIEVKKEDHDLLIDDVIITPSKVTCGGKIEVSAKVYNVGEKDQDDIKLKIMVADLGIEEYSEIFKLNDGKDVVKRVSLDIPSTAKTGDYWVEIIATFNDGDDQDSSGLTPFTVTCGGVAAEETLITGDSIISLPTTTASAKVGEKIKFMTTLSNTGDKTTTFVLSLSDMSGWAENSIEPSAVTLNAGASAPIYIYITPKSASTHLVTLSVHGDGQLLATQTLTVNVISAAEEAEIEITEWGHGVSISQTKDLISDYIGTAGLIVLIALLVVLGMTLYVVNNRRKSEVIYAIGKKKKRKR